MNSNSKFCRIGTPLLLLIMGCTTAKISSVPLRAHGLKLSRVFVVVVPNASGSGNVSLQLMNGLVNRLSTSGLIAKGGIKNFLDVKRDSSIQQEMKEFAPHQVLIIQEVGATFTNGLNTGATLVLQVDDVATQDTIWKARLASSWEFGADIQPIIAKVMEAMQGDGLLATGAVPQA